MSTQGNPSLLSILRNSVLLDLSENKLIIGLENRELFTSDKQEAIQRFAATYFQKNIRVEYQKSVKAQSFSLRAEELAGRKQKDMERKEKAKNSPIVQEILKVFPEGKIENITFLQKENEE